jgi:DNA polymerase-3 subunit epsilon
MERIICFDTETTGFDFANGEKIIEIGAIEVIDGQITDNTFHEYINPKRQISADAYNVHKISNAFVADKPEFPEVARRFLDFIGDSMLVAHNGKGFDFPFINFQLAECGLPKIPPERQEDTMLMAQRKIANIRSYSLDSLAKYFNISLETRAEAHGALIDTEILAKVYLELSRSADAKTVEEIAAEQHAAFLATPKIGETFPRRSFAPTEEELAAHAGFIAKIPKAKWMEAAK